jgi:hypothetical protein
MTNEPLPVIDSLRAIAAIDIQPPRRWRLKPNGRRTMIIDNRTGLAIGEASLYRDAAAHAVVAMVIDANAAPELRGALRLLTAAVQAVLDSPTPAGAKAMRDALDVAKQTLQRKGTA